MVGPNNDGQNYDAVLILSFGGPEQPDEVIPFLENVLRGRNIPRERMLEVAEHYYHFGGKSPINQQNRELIAGLADELERNGPSLPIYWGNRNWRPFAPTRCGRCKRTGFIARWRSLRRCSAHTPAAGNTWKISRRRARKWVPARLRVDKLRTFYNHPLFIEAFSDRVRAALDQIPAQGGAGAQIIYTAHSVPRAMAESSDYEQQLNESCRLVSESLGIGTWRLVYQSRSGAPGQPWLEPDIGDVLRGMEPGQDVVVAPIGFISDHMEVLYDLDTEARAISEERKLRMVRAATVGVHPKFLAMIRELIRERMGECEARAVGRYGPHQDVCRAECCPAPARRASSATSDSSPRAIAQR